MVWSRNIQDNLFTPVYLAVLLAWVSVTSKLPIPANMPEPLITIGVVAPGHEAETSYNGATKEGKIVLTHIETPPSKRNVCVVAHELTHWLQFYQPNFIFNPEKDEPIAYLVQIACLESYKDFKGANSMRQVLENNKTHHKW